MDSSSSVHRDTNSALQYTEEIKVLLDSALDKAMHGDKKSSLCLRHILEYVRRRLSACSDHEESENVLTYLTLQIVVQ